MFASRLTQLEPSPTLKAADEVARLRARGEDIISFTVGEPDYPTPAHIREAAKTALDQGKTHYTPSMGIPELREAIAKKSREENHISCEAKNVMVSPAKLALVTTMMALIEPGDEVFVPDPGWVSYDPMVRMAGGKTVFIPCNEKSGFAARADDMAQRLGPRTKALILNTPCNPTGGVMGRDDLKAVADLARDHDLWVISDEIYEKLIYEGEHVSVGSFPDMADRTITINGFSKAYAMTGWRLGWAVAPQKALAQMAKFHQHSISCCTSFAQYGGVAALEGPQDELERMRQEFHRRRDIMVKGLNDIPGVSCSTPKGAFYAFARYDHNIPSLKLAEGLVREAHVAPTAGAAFGPSGEGYLRFSYALSREKITEGLNRMGNYMEKL